MAVFGAGAADLAAAAPSIRGHAGARPSPGVESRPGRRMAPGEPDADRGPRTASAPAAGGRTPCPARGARGGARTQPRRDGRHDRRRGTHRARRVRGLGSGGPTSRRVATPARRTPAARSERAIRARQPHRQRRGRTPRRGQPWSLPRTCGSCPDDSGARAGPAAARGGSPGPKGLTEPAYPTHRPHRPARTVIVGPGPAHNRVPPATRDPRIDRPARIGLTAEHTCGFRPPMTNSRRGRAGTPSWRARRTRWATGKNARAERGGHGRGSGSCAGGRRCRASRRNRKAEVFDEVGTADLLA